MEYGGGNSGPDRRLSHPKCVKKPELSILAKGERGIAGARGTAHNRRRGGMAKFKIVTPVGASFSIAGVGYKLEMEGLGSLDAEIVEIADGTRRGASSPSG
jgi:hypothetical protein